MPQFERATASSQSLLVRGVREVGELSGGVTGALIEPPGMKSWGSLDVADDEPDDERVLSHGMRELASALPFTFAG